MNRIARTTQPRAMLAAVKDALRAPQAVATLRSAILDRGCAWRAPKSPVGTKKRLRVEQRN